MAKDRADPTLRRATVTVRCKAARRCMYFVWNIFSVTVSVNFITIVFNVSKYQYSSGSSGGQTVTPPPLGLYKMLIKKMFAERGRLYFMFLPPPAREVSGSATGGDKAHAPLQIWS